MGLFKKRQEPIDQRRFGYHFVRGRLRDGSRIPGDGEWLEHKGETQLCKAGLHGCRDPFDALKYTPGTTLCYCEFEDIMQSDGDKFVARRRKIIKRVNISSFLERFLRDQIHALIAFEADPDLPEIFWRWLFNGNEYLWHMVAGYCHRRIVSQPNFNFYARPASDWACLAIAHAERNLAQGAYRAANSVEWFRYQANDSSCESLEKKYNQFSALPENRVSNKARIDFNLKIKELFEEMKNEH